MKKLTFPLLLATALVAAGCSSDENVAEIDNSQRSAIELSGANSVSRAGFTEANTTLKLHYVSTKGNTSETLYMTSSATAIMNSDKDEAAVSKVEQTTGADGEKRYWDDIHAKESKLSLYAIAVPNKTSISKNATNFNAWDTKQKKGTATAVANTITWEVSASQTLDKIADEDLAYSNNVSGTNTLGFKDNKFEKAEGGKKLVFNHALSRFTINIKKGDGFGDFASSFNVSSVKFTGFDVKGTLDVVAGTISDNTSGAVEAVGTKAVYPATGTQTGYTYVAQVFPGTTIKDVADAMLTITVDGNVYPITGAKIYEALATYEANSEIVSELASLKPGKNYNLTINLKKTAIEITSAKLVDWDTINGEEMTPSNAINLTATMEKSAGSQTTIASDLYRSTEPTKGYTADGNKNTLSAENVLGSSWYWPNNSTEYYFRTISPQNTPVATSDPNTITMEGGAITDGNDYIWGALLEEKHGSATEHKFTYNNGYGDYLYSAIGPTESEIHLTQFHMMSNLQVNLTTSTGDDKVDLTNATVEILGAYNTATLALSNAAITFTGGKTASQAMTPNTGHTEHTYRAIPQTTTGITLKITAAGNVYNVKLPADTGIDAWLPGKSYVYTFKLVKTAIHITTAQLVDWEKVTARSQTVTIE